MICAVLRCAQGPVCKKKPLPILAQLKDWYLAAVYNLTITDQKMVKAASIDG